MNKDDYSAMLEQIYDRHIDCVYRVCFMYMKTPQDAEDMVHNTFLALLKQRKAFESEHHERAWLIRVAINLCKNELKHWRRKSEDISLVQLPDRNSDGEVTSLVLDLPDELKIPVYLHYYEGYKSEEIGEMLKISASAVRTRLQKAREILKENF